MMFIATVPLADTWGMHGDVGWGWMVLMMVVMVLFWGAIILGIVWLVRGGATGNWSLSGPREPTAAEILERRFAEGAISVEEYRERREVIGNGAAKPNGDRPREPLTTSTAGEGRR